MKASEEKYLLLLQRSFTGELTPEEARVLSDWRQAAPEHERTARTYMLIWERSSAFAPAAELDIEGDFQMMLTRLEAARSAPLERRFLLHGRRRQWLSVAALFLFLAAAVWFYKRYTLPAAALHIETAQSDQAFRMIDLPDGSRVWLRGGGRIEYPVQFAALERRIRLDGEAFFEVQHQPRRPFLVTTASGGVVEVLGTEFNVRSSNGGSAQSVLVKRGKVRFLPEQGSKGVVLTTGMRAEYHTAKRRLLVAERKTLNELSWKTGGLEFVSTPLEEVVEDIGQHYGVTVELRNPGMASCLYTAPLTNQPLEKVLQSLSLIYRFKIEQPANGRYLLVGGSCR
jgi:transmembrane sensor